MKVVRQSVSLEAHTPEPEQVIERAGRTCYRSEDRITPDSAMAFIRMIRKRGHLSVIEHATASVRIVCDRGVSHEFVRHRIFSYSQESTRYCNYAGAKFAGEISVVEPPDLTPEDREDWEAACAESERRYLRMVGRGCRPELARGVLPTSLRTELVGTANLREWMHFLTLRTAPGAHPQMREVAFAIRGILREVAPTVFEEF